MTLKWVVLVVGFLVAASCGEESARAVPYSSANALGDALIEAGIDCPLSGTEDFAEPGVETAGCDVNGEFVAASVYEEQGKWEAFIPELEHGPAWEDTWFVVGPNWGLSVGSEEPAQSVQSAIGGRRFIGEGDGAPK